MDGPGKPADRTGLNDALDAARQARALAGPDAAVMLLAGHLATHPRDAAALTQRGQALWAAGDRDTAMDAWGAAIRHTPGSVPARIRLARALRMLGDRAAARLLVEAVLADAPRSMEVRIEQALLLQAEGDRDAALRAMDAAVADGPTHAGALQERAAMRLAVGDEAGHDADLHAAVAANPSLIHVRLRLGRALRARGALAKAEAAFRAALADAPQDARIVAELTRLLVADRREAEALALLAAARGDAPTLALIEAEALRGLSRRTEAAACLAPLAATDDRARAWLALDRLALARPARFAAGAAREAERNALVAALARLPAGQLGALLSASNQAAHPLDGRAVARCLRRDLADPEARLVSVVMESHALTTLGLARDAAVLLEDFAATQALAGPLAARLATRRGHVLLSTGDRVGAAAQFEAAYVHLPGSVPAASMLAILAEPTVAECLALLGPGVAEASLRPWIADRAAAALAPDDPRLTLTGLGPRDRAVTEALLRRNVAVARGDAAGARAMLAAIFAQYGLDCPQPAGASAGIAHFACPPAAPVDGPLVSVVMSAFGAEETVGCALDSVLAQSWRNIEVLVVDDASPDGTAAIVAAAAARDPRIRPVANRRNAGTYASRNHALGLARGDWVTFHDSDDWMHPRRIEREMAAFDDAAVMAVNSQWFRMDADGRAGIRLRGPTVFGNPSFLLFRADALRRLGAYDPVRASGDTEMLWRARLVFGADAVRILPDILTVGSSRPGSLTRNSATGLDTFGFNPLRLAYHEAWCAWHEACDERGVVPHIAPGGVPPHLAALPADILAGEAG